MLLPAYTLLLRLIALLGYMAYAAGVKPATPNEVVPALFEALFPGWFAGFAFAAIAIGALVPAAVMSIGAANLFTRWFTGPALLAGWVVGSFGGTLIAWTDGLKPLHTLTIGGSNYTLYVGVLAVVANLLVTVVVNLFVPPSGRSVVA